MRRLSIKNRTHRMHMPNRHSIVMHVNHMVHDGRFWAICVFAAILAMMLTAAILLGNQGPQIRFWTPMTPTLPPMY